MNASTPPFTIAIIGAGPAGLFAAELLSAKGCRVTIFDSMPSVARKFHMAGRSGLNLTHDEPFERFLTRYGTAQEWLAPALKIFPPTALRKWAEDLGQPCFVGSSGRISPKAIKASPLPRAWLGRLAVQNAEIRTRRRLKARNADGNPILETPDGPATRKAAANVLAMGGASW